MEAISLLYLFFYQARKEQQEQTEDLDSFTKDLKKILHPEYLTT